ncbi:four-carbon acid sugar kinase family protein [Saccharopolyspora spinosporotrichia]
MRDLAVLALADDLSGAAETAAALMSSALRADLALDPGAMVSAYNAQNGAEARALVVDLDTRQSDAERAGAALAHVLAQRGPTGPRVLVKIDSLLRGNVAATLSAVGPAVLAPALPVGGRTVVAGAVRVNGAPLRETTAWGTEPGSAPDSIAQVLAPAPCRSVSLSEIRRDPRSAIAESLAAGRIPVCDSETDSDLDAVVAATPPEVALVGSGGLAAALGRSFRQRKAAPRPEFAPREDRALLVVVGTAEPGASVQVHRLVEAGRGRWTCTSISSPTGTRFPARSSASPTRCGNNRPHCGSTRREASTPPSPAPSCGGWPAPCDASSPPSRTSTWS